MRAVAAAVAAAVLAGLVAGCGGDPAGSDTASPATGTSAQAVAQSKAGCVADIGVMAPYGDRAGTDPSLMNWARLSLDAFNQAHGTAFHIAPADVDGDVAPGKAAARRFAADSSVVAVVGPKTSGVTQVVGPILDRAGIPYVSPTATAESLADGHLRLFHRVVPDDSLQAQAIGGFIVGPLGGKRVVVVRNLEPYSTGLAAGITAYLRAHGITPIAQVAVRDTQRDMATVVPRIPSDADVLVLPMLEAGQAARLVTAVRRSGRNPSIIGGDALFVPEFARSYGAFVSSYAPDIKGTDAGNQAVRIYQGIFGDFSPYGSPAYIAMEVAATAALEGCEQGRTSRAGTAAALDATDLPSIAGLGRVRFLANGNVAGGQYYIYRVVGSGYQLVR